MKVLIADDEPLARERLRNFLGRDADLTIVGECANGEEAAFAILRDRPDILLLDVQMPGLTGFEVLQKIGVSNAPPAVIFVTAHDHFALKAFEVHAVDYLLKPFDRTRLETAMARAKTRVRANKGPETSTQLTQLLAELNSTQKTPDRISIKSNGRVNFVQILDIDWVGSADNYVELHVGAHCHLLRETMTAFSERLPQDQFVRISRTAIVNMARVKELQALFHGEYSVTLTTGAKLTLSRSYRNQLGRLGVK
jgi:two-component system LytT family response regulator